MLNTSYQKNQSINTYSPYRKPNNELPCVNKHSNHRASIANQIPSMISTQISENSCDKNDFN